VLLEAPHPAQSRSGAAGMIGKTGSGAQPALFH
jgi:hypothetical protein